MLLNCPYSNIYTMKYLLLILTITICGCSKFDDSHPLAGRYRTATKHTFGELVMTTRSGVITDQGFISNFLAREGNTFFNSQQPVNSIRFNFNDQGAIIHTNQSKPDTAAFKVKEDNFILLEYQRSGYFPTFPQYDNACDMIAEKINRYPLTGSCEPSGWGISCHHMEYYPIEISNGGLSITAFTYLIKSFRSYENNTYARCSRANSGNLSVSNTGFETSLQPGDTVVIQKIYIALIRD